MKEPKPCPFCGCRKVKIVDGSTFRWIAVECYECGAKSGEVRIPAYDPETMSSATNQEERREKAIHDAIEEWNTRIDATALERLELK
jgi:Lar family restriction alleviation protein